MCSPPNTFPHHSFSFISLYLWPAPHFSFSFFFFFFIFHLTLLFTPSNSPANTSIPPFPPLFCSQCHQKILKNPQAPSHPFFEVKISNHFGGFYTFTWGYFYLSFNNDTHVIYEHWKWYLCVYMYEFCMGGIIWWVGLWFVLMMTT